MKLIHKDNYKLYIIGLLSLLITVAVLPILPEQIPIHFNAEGVADGFGGKLSIFMFPGIIIAINLLCEVFRHADPRSANYTLFNKHYYLFFMVFDLFMLLVQMYVISFSLELITLNVSNLIIVAMGILFVFIGNLMPKLKQNYFMGIRTPWTLANGQVWYDTHRFCGKVWFIAGILICICGFLPPELMIFILLAIISIAVLIPLIYSYVRYRQLEQQKNL